MSVRGKLVPANYYWPGQLSSGWKLSAQELASRFKDIASFVERIPEEQFLISDWWLPDGLWYDHDRDIEIRMRPGPCGCAVGHLCRAGMFGLDLDFTNQRREIVFARLGDLLAVRIEFAKWIFDQYAYKDEVATRPTEVAARIRVIAGEAVTKRERRDARARE